MVSSIWGDSSNAAKSPYKVFYELWCQNNLTYPDKIILGENFSSDEFRVFQHHPPKAVIDQSLVKFRFRVEAGIRSFLIID